MSVPKVHLGRAALAPVLLLLIMAAFTSVLMQPTVNASSGYWAKYEFHEYSKDKSEHVIVYVYVDLSDPEYPDVETTGHKVISGNFDSTQLAGAETAATFLINHLVQIVANPNELPSNGIIKKEKYNITVYEVYDTKTGLLKYAKLSKEDGNYVYEMKLVDTNVKPGWLGATTTSQVTTTTTTSSTTYTSSTSSSGTVTPSIKDGQYVTYHIDIDIVDKSSGYTIKGSGDVKYVLSVEYGYIRASDVKVSNVHIDKLPGETTEDQFKRFLAGFLENYLAFWLPPNQLKTNEVKNLNVGKFKAAVSYDKETGLLKYAYLTPNSDEVSGNGVKIELIDTDVPALKGSISRVPASNGGGEFGGGILTAIIGAVVTAAIVVVAAVLLKRRRAKTAIHSTYEPTYPPPGTPPPPPG